MKWIFLKRWWKWILQMKNLKISKSHGLISEWKTWKHKKVSIVWLKNKNWKFFDCSKLKSRENSIWILQEIIFLTLKHSKTLKMQKNKRSISSLIETILQKLWRIALATIKWKKGSNSQTSKMKSRMKMCLSNWWQITSLKREKTTLNHENC